MENQFAGSVTLEDEGFWCLLCGEDGPRWKTSEEMMEHMKTTVHRSKDGGIAFYNPQEDG